MEKGRSEAILWDSFRSGNEEAFVRLFHLYADLLFYYGCSITPDRDLVKDSIQELLCSLWERGPDCPTVTNLKAFLFTSLRRQLLRKLQYDRRYEYLEENEAAPEYELPNESVEAEIIRRETDELSRQRLQFAVKNLPNRQREAIHLRYYEGLSYEEIAQVMEVKKGTVGRFIAQAIDGLRKAMDQVLLFALLMLTYLLS